MRKVLALCLAVLTAGWASTSVIAAPKAPMNPAVPRRAPSRFEDNVQQANVALQAEDWPGVYAALKPIIGGEELEAQPSARRHALLQVFATAAFTTDHPAEALSAIKAACALPEADSQDWLVRLYAASSVKDGAEIVLAMTTLAERWPAEVRALDYGQVGQLHMEVSRLPDPTDALARFDAALLTAAWAPDVHWHGTDEIWVEYAGILLDRGDVAGARTVAAKVTQPGSIVAMRADRRFDVIVRRDDPAFDPRRAAEAELAWLDKAALTSPRLLDILLGRVGMLRRLGRNDEALSLIEGALARIKAEGNGAYSDLEDKTNWLYDLKARLLMDAGRVEEALAIQTSGAGLQEDGRVNVSQALNLGYKYFQLGRPRDALRAIAKVGPMSTYGEMVRLYVESCANAQLGETARARADIAEMRKRWPVNGEALLGALLCIDDQDGAAQVLIRQLEDPQQRTGALASLQVFRDRAFVPPFEKVIEARFKAVTSRPDVQATVARYGRIETYDDLWPGDT